MNIGLTWKPEYRSTLSRATGPVACIRGMRRRWLSFLSSRRLALPLAVGFSLLVVAATAANLKAVQVRDADGSQVFYTFRTNPVSILKQHGITLSADDRYDVTSISHNKARIDLHMAFPVVISADKSSHTILLAKGSVADALSKAGISVGSDDLVNFPLTQEVRTDMNIVVQRVKYQTVVQTQPIGHTVSTQTTAKLKKGVQQVASQGRDGEIATTLKQRYVDGNMTGQEVVSQAVTVQPVNGTILVGTAEDKPVVKASGTPAAAKSSGGASSTGRGAPTQYSRLINTVATGYSPVDGTRTATGRTAQVGCVAVDPNMIPLGSRLYIETADGSFSYGYAVAADTGGFVNNGSGVGVDLFFASAQQASNFGRKHVKVYVLG